MYDKPGTGLSDPIPHLPTLEERGADIEAVLDAAGSERAVLFGISEGGPSSVVLAATRPERITSLILYGTFAVFPGLAPEAYSPEVVQRDEAKIYELRETLKHRGDGARLSKIFAPILGWSMGGFVAQRLAVDHPQKVSHLILAGTNPGGSRTVLGSPNDFHVPAATTHIQVLREPSTTS